MPNERVATALTELWASTKRVLFIVMQIIGIGLSGIFVLWVARQSGVFSGLSISTDPTMIAALIFMVGVIILGFLWYLTRRGFQLLSDPAMTPERLAIMKDLPLGLPEGTVRAILALVVGTVGLPLLLFMDPLGIPEGTAALVANIITGVFAFYFGQRTGGGDAQAARTLTGTVGALQADKTRLETSNKELATVNTMLKGVADTTLGQTVQAGVARVEGLATLADTLVTTFGPVLPKGLLPDGVTSAISQARNVAAGVKALSQGELTPDTLSKLTGAAGSLLSDTGLGGLLSKAGGALLPMAGIGGPLAGVALVLSIGWKLQSAQYRRWRARILAAPWDPAVIDPGMITAVTAENCLPRCKIFNTAFATVKDTEAGFYTNLINDVLADDAVARLWSRYGGNSAMFANEGVLREGVAEFRMALMTDQASHDIDEAQITEATKALTDAANPALRPAAAPSVAAVAKVLDESHGRTGVPEDATAALQALVMLVGTAREKGIDLPKLLSELPQ